jgi:Uma2 family endonuclease
MSTVSLPPPTVFADEGPLRLDADSTGTLMTVDEFLGVTDYDDLYFYELINGVVIISRSKGPAERGANGELGCMLRQHWEDQPQGSALNVTLYSQEVRTDRGVRRVDRAIWAGFRSFPDVEHDVPTIIIEFVSSPSRNRKRDYIDKRDEFARLGVAEYWVFDRFRRTLSVCIANEPVNVVREQEVYKSPRLPGFEFPLARLLSIADRYRPA